MVFPQFLATIEMSRFQLKGGVRVAKILLVEDDPILGKGLMLNLELDGHRVTWEQTLKGARHRNDNFEYDLMLLDLNLPDGSGLTLCHEIRETDSRLPIIILTAKTDEDSVVTGLAYGANDYVKKPFSSKELLARIKTALREPGRREDQLRVGPVLVLLDQRRALVDGHDLELNRREFDIFAHLVRRASAVVSREQIITLLNPEGEMTDRTIDSHVSHIRSKLKKSHSTAVTISSVYGMGYKLEVS